MSVPKNFGSVDLLAATPTNVFQGPVTGGSFSITVVNRGAVNAKIKLGFSTTSATFQNSGYIEFETILKPKQVLERSGLVIQDNTKYVVGESDVANVNMTAYGWSV